MQLVRESVAGSHDAFTKIYDRHRSYTRSVLFRIVSQEDLDDAVQTTFIRVYENLHSFQGGAKLSTWIHRVAVNTGLMMRRSQNSRGAKTTVSLDETYEGSYGESVPVFEPGYEDRTIDSNADRVLVEKAMAMLGDQDNAVLGYILAGYSIEEIASSLGWTAAATKSHMHRARTRLKAAVTEIENPAPKAVAPVKAAKVRRCLCGCGTLIGPRGYPYAKGHAPRKVKPVPEDEQVAA